MLIHQISYFKYSVEPTMTLQAGEHYLYLLHRSRVRFVAPAEFLYEGQRTITFLRPGQCVTMERIEEYFAYDLLEFSPEGDEIRLVNELPLPTAPYTATYFYATSGLIQTMSFTYYSADKYRTEKNNATFLAILYGTASGDEEPTDKSPGNLLYHKIRRLRVLACDDSKNWTVAAAAKYVGLSESRFSTLYKRIFGTTFMSDVIRNRIQGALDLLKNTDASVAEIAREAGYDDVAFFHRQFKKQMGITPRKYRELIRSNSKEES